MHIGAQNHGNDLLAGNAILQLWRERATRLFGCGLQCGKPFAIRSSVFPLGDGPIRLPGYHGVDSDLRGDIDGLLIMPALRQGLHKSQPGDRLCLPDEFADFSNTIIRVVKHYGKPQPPAIGKLELVALLQTHGLHGMASDLRRQGQLPSNIRFVGIHRHVVLIGIKQEYSIRHGS